MTLTSKEFLSRIKPAIRSVKRKTELAYYKNTILKTLEDEEINPIDKAYASKRRTFSKSYIQYKEKMTIRLHNKGERNSQSFLEKMHFEEMQTYGYPLTLDGIGTYAVDKSLAWIKGFQGNIQLLHTHFPKLSG